VQDGRHRDADRIAAGFRDAMQALMA
jgi:hypothetical protein